MARTVYAVSVSAGHTNALPLLTLRSVLVFVRAVRFAFGPRRDADIVCLEVWIATRFAYDTYVHLGLCVPEQDLFLFVYSALL